MSTTSPDLPPTSRRLSAIHDLLLDIATALGALRENGRLTEARLDRHGERLASAEARITSHQQAISSWNPSSRSQPLAAPMNPTPTSANSTATSPTATATDTSSIWRRAIRAFTKEGAKEILPWLAGRVASILLPYILPAALAALAWLTPFGRALWRLLAG